ncbi:ATP-dependent helicase [Nitratiruptor sp. YY09-18]|uniref:ATP-dependent helicase n=1 Tax=Nitratiruptor sp. YY09-18 TaxID=2724901 RepID=UPI001916692F|nr:ATP-dependent helicase [Nitratiruptor sp. YY09-18]BCD68066.1 DNA helicase II / ATP-dependent DNA helicase PcrA [Nitratiruptor sp. YY09-18]
MLNVEQMAAVNAPLGYNLVIASAGTGKTSTIVARIERLLDQGIAPEDILLLTFTNKAAAEMVVRVERKFGKIARKIEAGTFHAVSYRWLKELDPKVVLKQPKELKILFKSIYEKRNFSLINDTKPYAASSLFDYYSFYQNSEFSLTFGKWIAKRNSEQEVFAEAYNDIVLEYEELKRSYGFLSFNDLLLQVIDNKDKIKNFQEILVDEYQDTNNLQGKFIDALKFQSLFCVGDYDQSIYAFNGANIDIIATFKERYPQARIFTLSKNYRSTEQILELANRVISYNERIYPKKLEVVNTKQSVPPKLLVFDDLYMQYEGIAKRIKTSLTPRDEIAVIFRNNASADGIEAALREQGISCKRKGSRSLFELKEIKALFDLLSILINPKDLLAFIHIFEYAKGVGANIAKELFEGLAICGEGDIKRGLLNPINIKNPFQTKSRNYQLGLFDDCVQLGSKTRFSDISIIEHPIFTHPKLSQEGAEYLQNLHDLFQHNVKKPHSFLKLIKNSFIFINIIDVLAKQRAKLKDGSIDPKLYDEAIEKIQRRIALIEHISKTYEDVYRFYNAMVLGGNEIAQGEGVNLLTIHASKGLEFHEVYVVDLMEGRFPNLKLASKGGSIEEERRLFYVAVTRAKEVLYLSYARYDRVKKQEFLPSRFLKEAGLVQQ